MKALTLISTILTLSATISCSPLKKESSAPPAKQDELGLTVSSLDLGCSFEAITAQIADDTPSSEIDDKLIKTLGSCDRAREHYAILLSKYDDNRDGDLSASETADVAWAFKQARELEVDKNNDGVISDDEITLWRAKNLPTRSGKLEAGFSSACSKLTKDKSSCRELYTEKCRQRTGSTTVDDKGGLNKDVLKKDDRSLSEKSAEYGKDDMEHAKDPVVRVPVKVKVDVCVDVTKCVNYINFDEDYAASDCKSCSSSSHY